MTYHLGRGNTPQVCRAVKGKCPYGDSPHYATLEEAEHAAEEKNSADVSTALSKSASSSSGIRVMDVPDDARDGYSRAASSADSGLAAAGNGDSNGLQVDRNGVPLPPRPNNGGGSGRGGASGGGLDGNGTGNGSGGSGDNGRGNGRNSNGDGKRSNDGSRRLDNGMTVTTLRNPNGSYRVFRAWADSGMRVVHTPRYGTAFALDDGYQGEITYKVGGMYRDKNGLNTLPFHNNCVSYVNDEGYKVIIEEPSVRRKNYDYMEQVRVSAYHPDQSVFMVIKPSAIRTKPIVATSAMTRRALDDIHDMRAHLELGHDSRVNAPIKAMQYTTNDGLTGTVHVVYGKPPAKPGILHPLLRRRWKQAREQEHNNTVRGIDYSLGSNPRTPSSNGLSRP